MATLTTSDGTTVWWAELGGGPGRPVVLIQGLGYDADMWHAVTPYLVRFRPVIVLDNRGVGRNAVPDQPWSMADMADDVVAVLDAAGVDAAHVVGFSMGGVIAQEVALRHRDRVTSLALVATHPGGREAARTSKEAAAMLTDRTARSRAEVVERSVPFLYVESTPRERIQRDLDIRMSRPLRAKGYWGQWEAMRLHEGTAARLSQLDGLPVLVVHGKQDALVNPDNAAILHAAIPGSGLVMVEGASHLVMTDQVQAFGDLLALWLARND